MNSNYKQLREEFIRGHNGSDVSEVVVMTCWTNCQLSFNLSLKSIPGLNSNQSFVLDFCLTIHLMINWFVLPLIVTMVSIYNWIYYNYNPFLLLRNPLSNYIYLICFSILLITFIVMFVCFIKTSIQKTLKPLVMKELFKLRLVWKSDPISDKLFSPFIVCLYCILAVDFRVFIPTFCQNRDLWLSLMDVGGRLFSLQSTEDFLPNHDLEPILTSNHYYSQEDIPFYYSNHCLGFQRLIAVKSLEYQLHSDIQ